jgi:hypothetical protein
MIRTILVFDSIPVLVSYMHKHKFQAIILYLLIRDISHPILTVSR